jgi:hypothetical protein
MSTAGSASIALPRVARDGGEDDTFETGAQQLLIKNATVTPAPRGFKEWTRHQLVTINLANIALLITVLIVSREINVQIDSLRASTERLATSTETAQKLLVEVTNATQRAQAVSQTVGSTAEAAKLAAISAINASRLQALSDIDTKGAATSTAISASRLQAISEIDARGLQTASSINSSRVNALVDIDVIRQLGMTAITNAQLSATQTATTLTNALADSRRSCDEFNNTLTRAVDSGLLNLTALGTTSSNVPGFDTGSLRIPTTYSDSTIRVPVYTQAHLHAHAAAGGIQPLPACAPLD